MCITNIKFFNEVKKPSPLSYCRAEFDRASLVHLFPHIARILVPEKNRVTRKSHYWDCTNDLTKGAFTNYVYKRRWVGSPEMSCFCQHL